MITREQNKEMFEKFLLDTVINKKNIFFVVTTSCNLECAMCSYSYGRSKSEPISKEVIDIAMSQIDLLPNKEDLYLCLYGGEPMLEPEVCVYIAEKAHSIGTKVSIFTNGFWGSNDKLVSIVRDKIKPDYIMLSVDEYHDISRECTEHIIETFKDDTLMLLATFTDDPTIKYYLDKYQNQYPNYSNLLRLGRAKNILKYHRYYTHEKINWGACRTMGWNIHPNGDIGCECCRSIQRSCKFGNLLKGDNLKDMMGLNVYYIFTQDPDFCENHQDFNCFKPDPKYNKEMMLFSLEQMHDEFRTRLDRGYGC